MNESIIYDDAQRHLPAVEHAGLDAGQADVHTAFFLAWLIDRDFVSATFRTAHRELLKQHRSGDRSAIDIYRAVGRRLSSDMLSDEGNAFAQAYYQSATGQYLQDYAELLVGDLPSDYHVTFSGENRELIQRRIDDRYAVWRASHLRA